MPGDRPDRFDKAAAAGADAVILDLEDAVAPESKHQALDHVASWLAGGGRAVVRVNASGTTWHDAEIDVLRPSGAPIMLPKTECRDALATVAARLSGTPRIIALIETARGVRDIDDLCAEGGVARIALGNVDLSAELGVDAASQHALAYTRGRLVIASASAGLPAPIDGVTTAIDDLASLERDTEHGQEMGFGGKLCIHPRQVQTVNTGYSPTASDVAWARRIVNADGGAGGVLVVDGKMVDAPLVRRAQHIIAQDRNSTQA